MHESVLLVLHPDHDVEKRADYIEMSEKAFVKVALTTKCSSGTIKQLSQKETHNDFSNAGTVDANPGNGSFGRESNTDRSLPILPEEVPSSESR